MADTARVTQSAVEAMTLQNGDARVTQSVIEFLTAVGIACGNPPAGIAGTFYSHTFPAGGGTTPYTFAIASGALPSGLTLNTSTGVVSGVPTTGGIYSFTISVTDAFLWTAVVSCAITIAQGSAPNYGAAKQKTCPPQRRTQVNWEDFSRRCEAQRPMDVEEVRSPWNGKLRTN